MKNIHTRIEQWRQQPEDDRLRTAITLTIAIGIVLTFIILAIMLPLQIYLR